MSESIKIIHPYSIAPAVELIPDRNCPNTHYYIIPARENFLQMAKTMYQFEKEMNNWVRAYGNVLKGLQYWRSRAQEVERK